MALVFANEKIASSIDAVASPWRVSVPNGTCFILNLSSLLNMLLIQSTRFSVLTQIENIVRSMSL